MKFDIFIDNLKQELNIETLETTDKGFRLVLDRSIVVEMISHRNQLVLLSNAPSIAGATYQKEQQIMQAMNWSLAWKNGNIQLSSPKKRKKITLFNSFGSPNQSTHTQQLTSTKNDELADDNSLYVQTNLPLTQSYELLREALNAHCQFIEQLTVQDAPKGSQHVFIRP